MARRRTCVCCSTTSTVARARRSEPGSSTCRATWSSSRTRTSNTTHGILKASPAYRGRSRRRRLQIEIRRRGIASRPVILAFGREPAVDALLQHDDQSQPDRHGNLLQDVSSRSDRCHLVCPYGPVFRPARSENHDANDCRPRRRDCGGHGAPPGADGERAAQRPAPTLQDDARLGAAAARGEVGRGHRRRARARRIDLRDPSLLRELLRGTDRSAHPQVRPERQTAQDLGRGHVRVSRMAPPWTATATSG